MQHERQRDYVPKEGPQSGHGMEAASDVGVYQTKRQSVVETLRHWILIGRLEPGQRLDQEWLATTLQVSRMPLRQALVQLAADGLIINRPHSSAIVAPLSVALLEDIYASRQALEGMLAEAGAKHIDEASIELMQQLIEQQEAAIEKADIEGYVRLDRMFHSLLYRSSGYEQSCALIDRLRDMSDRYIRFYAQDTHGAHKSILEHWKILRAIEKKEPKQVRHYIERHICDGCTALLSVVREHEKRNASEINVNKK